MKMKKITLFIAMLASLTMFVGCSSTATDTTTGVDSSVSSTDTSSDTSIDTDAVTDAETSTDDTSVEGEVDMENIELTEEEMLALLGLDGDSVTVKDGELLVEIGTHDLTDFDTVFNATNFDFSYNGNEWIESGFEIPGTEVVLVDTNPVDFDSPANIYITPITEIPSYISMNEYIDMVVESSLGAFGVEVLSQSVDFYGDYEIGMLETVERYTEELILEFIDLGYMSQEEIDEIGGIEVLTALPDMYQVFMVARNGSASYTFSGAYYANDDKRSNIISALDGFLQSLTPQF